MKISRKMINSLCLTDCQVGGWTGRRSTHVCNLTQEQVSGAGINPQGTSQGNTGREHRVDNLVAEQES